MFGDTVASYSPRSRNALVAGGLLLGFAAMLAFASTVPADSDERPRDEPPSDDRHVSSADEALRLDAEHIASERGGWDADATLARLRRQQRFDKLSKELAAAHPDVYAGGWMGDGPDGKPFVRFTSENVPDDVRERAEAHNLTVAFKPGANNSLRELTSRTQAVHDDLLDHDNPEVATAYSVRDQTIDATAQRPPDSYKSDQELHSRLSRESRASDVQIVFIDASVSSKDHSYGGLVIWDDSDNDGVRDGSENDEPECTTGFAVTHDNGTSGVTTAGHCTSMDQIEERNGNTYDTDFVSQHIGEFGDLEWHTTPHVEPAEFYTDWSTRRDVEAVEWESSIDQGDLYCKFGKTTGRSCDEVYRESVTVTKDNGTTLEDQTVMEQRKAAPGDSGGPWYISTRAAGSHTGRVEVNGSKRDYWGKAVDFDNALDIFPKTK